MVAKVYVLLDMQKDKDIPIQSRKNCILLAWYLLDKKGMKIGKVFVIFIIIAVVSSLTGLLII